MLEEIGNVVEDDADPGAVQGDALAFGGVEAGAPAAPSLFDAHPHTTEPAGHDRGALNLVPPASACLVWSWCTVTEDHGMRTSYDVRIEQPGGGTVLDARVMAEDGRDGGPGLAPFIGYCETNLTPDELRAEVSRIRTALPRLMARADIADGNPTTLSAAQVLANLDRFLTTDGDPKVSAFVDCVKELVRNSNDPAAMVENISFTLTRHRAHESAEAQQALTEFLTEHNITQMPADGPNGNALREPLYFAENCGRFLVPPADADPAAVLAYVQDAFAHQKQTAEPRIWTITTHNGVNVSGHLPAWADGDPSEPACPADRLELHLADLTHCAPFDGQPVSLCAPGGPGMSPDQYEESLFSGSITCSPYSNEPAERVPVVNIAVVQDHVIENLDPDGVAAVAAKLRAQAHRLEWVAQQLANARVDWAANAKATA